MNIPVVPAKGALGVLALAGYVGMAVVAYTHPAALTNPAGALAMGTVGAWATSVFTYYFGSSAGSADKGAQLAAIHAAATSKTPAPPAPGP